MRRLVLILAFLIASPPLFAQTIKAHAGALAAGSLEDVTSLIHGTYLYGASNTASSGGGVARK